MASVTATIMVGGSHPYEPAFDPRFVLELWEGSRATWVVRNVADGKVVKRIEPEMPAFIAGAAVLFLSEHIAEIGEDTTVVVSPLADSTLMGQVHIFEKLVDCDLHILQPVYSRVRSAWGEGWMVRDDRPELVG